MKLKQSIRYQLADFIGPVIVYYGIVAAAHVVLFLAWIFTPATIHLGGGLTVFSGLFLFICGLCSFHDNLPMHLQNGVSRKTMYTAWLVVTVIVSAAMAAADTVLATLIDFTPLWSVWQGGNDVHLFISCFGLKPLARAGFGEAAILVLFSWLFSFVLLALAMTLGYFIVVFFYRLPVKLRIVVGACAGFLLFFGVPGLQLVNDALGYPFSYIAEHYLWPLEDAIVASPLLTMGTWAAAAVALAAVTWLILRRTTVAR